MGSGAGGGVVVVFLAGFGGGIFNISKLGKFPETSIDDTHNEIINKANLCAHDLLQKPNWLLYLKNLRKIKTEKINKIFNNERINILPNTNLTLN